MQSAKDAISRVTGQSGQHRTDVDESVNPAVTQETIKPHRHEEATEAVDKEIHQHHYHTTVQPVGHQETLPERHVSNVLPTQEKSFNHANEAEDEARAARDLGQFQNVRQTAPTSTSVAAGPSVTGEHTHHHVHETVQPVVHKTTHQPEVVHTTIPVHEKHIAPSEHHGLSTLPMKSLNEVQGMGVDLRQGTHRHRDEYEGHPKPYNPEMQEYRAPVDLEPRKHDGTHDIEKTGHLEEARTRPMSSGNSGWAGAAGRQRLSGSGGTSGVVGGLISGTNRTDIETGMHDHSDRTGAAGAAVGGAALAGAGSHHGGHGTATSTRGGIGGPTSAGRDAYDEQASRGPFTGTTGSSTAGDRGYAGMTSSGYGTSGTTGSNLNPTGGLGSDRGTTSTDASDYARRDLDQSRSAAETTGTQRSGQEPSNMTGGRAGGDSTTSRSTAPVGTDDNVQHASRQGQDPSLVKDGNSKLTGTGVPGSHSAVFGLTKDGSTYDDTAHGQESSGKIPNPADKEGNSQGNLDNSSRAPTGAGVSEQLDDPRVAQKGHSGSAHYANDDDTKPGAGANTRSIV